MRVISTLALTNSAARPLGGNLCENLRCDHCHTLTYDLCGSNKATIRTLVDGEASAREGSGNGLMEGNCCAVQGDVYCKHYEIVEEGRDRLPISLYENYALKKVHRIDIANFQM